jgi:hypothetical protein
MSDPRPSPEILEAVRNRVRASLAPVTPLASPGVRATGIFLMGLLSTAALLAAKTPRQMSEGELAGLVLLVAGAVASAWAAARLAIPGCRVPLTVRASILAAPALFAAWVLAAGVHGGGLAPAHCLPLGVGVGLPAAALAVFLCRRAYPTSPPIATVACAISGGLWGEVALCATCPSESTGHLLLLHGGVLLIAVAGGWIAGPFFLE